MSGEITVTYDINKFYLGKLCKRGHEYETTGQSLRYQKSKTCPLCSQTWNTENPDKAKERSQNYEANHRINRRQKNRLYYANNVQKEKERRHETYLANKQRDYETSRRWQVEHPEQVRENRHNRYIRERSNDAQRIVDNLRKHLRLVLREHRTSTGAMRHLPYSAADFVNHIYTLLDTHNEKCPECGGDIGNGKYHIDHIVPLKTATTFDEVIGLFALNNLRPICGTCNLKKGGKINICQVEVPK